MKILKTKKFFPLFITQFLGAFNDNLFKNSLLLLITYKGLTMAQLSPGILANLTSTLFVLPFFIFSAPAGQIADKYEKSSLIRKLKIFEIFLMILAIAGLFLNNITLLFATLFFLGLQAAFFGPLKYSILPQHLKETELVAGNGLIEVATAARVTKSE